MVSPSALSSAGGQCAEQHGTQGGAMERLRRAQHRWRRLLRSDSGRGWYTPPAALPTKSGSGPPDPAAHKTLGKRRTVIARHGPYQSDYHSISKGYQGNSIRTTKYTLISFIPMNLFEQFHRAANLYFLFLVVLNWVPVVEAFQKEITMIPLVVVLTVIAFKDALEDYRRYCFDKKINNLVTKVYSGKQQRYVDQRWRDVRVGDFVRLSCNEIIPADMVLLYSSEPDGVCHIETANLDGETNLKQRQVVQGLAEQDFEVTPEKFTSRIECESPNNDLSRFRGFMEHSNKVRVGLHNENLLLRSCTIRNTETVIGIVVYAGHGLWLSGLKDPPFMIPDDTSPALAGFYMFFTMIIVLQVLIPISLYVSIEIVKLGQIYFIQHDIDFYNERLNSTIQCRALNITEDLGQIQHLFSDKTGTLTENKMVFRRCTIAGVEYPHEDNARRLELYGDQDWDDGSLPMGSRKSRSSMRSLSCHSGVSLHSLPHCDPEAGRQGDPQDTPSPRHTAFSSRMEKEVLPDPLLLLKLNRLNSQELPALDEGDDASLELTYIVDFFLALAVCNTVVVSAPQQPRHTVPEVPRTPLKSLEDVKLLFQRFGIPRFATLSPSGAETSPDGDSPSSFARRFFGRTPPPQPSPAGTDTQREEPEVMVGGTKLTMGGAEPTVGEVELTMDKAEPTVGGAESATGGAEQAAGGAEPAVGGAEQAEAGPVYEAESPDEAALVHAARVYGCTLRARASGQLVTELPGVGRLHVPLLHVLPFDSARKRMSVVVRHPLTGRVVVYTKGADSAKRRPPRSTGISKGRHRGTWMNTPGKDCALYVLEEEEYETWLKRHVFAETSIENREELLMESTHSLENGLTLLGATGIVDRLQEDVPETIEALQRAGIRVWILTGDKQETAVNIACACKLLRPCDHLLTANCSSKEACEALLADLKAVIEASGVGLGQASEAGFTLVIDGRTLDWALQEDLEDAFLDLTRQCRAVICCRSTPLQKSQVVRLVRDSLKVTTLAIGDGANDVSMIQVADVGVGISGQEGMQAVMSSDFAVSRFKHLRKLLLVHGHWCYTRLANMTLYFFYKNVAYVNLLFWYQFYCGFSGATMTNYWVLIFFNLLFTSAPPIIYGVLDKDVSADTLTQLPELYRAGQNSEAYLPFMFWVTMLDALYQSLICFFIPYLAYAGSDISVFSFGTPINTSALFIILLHQVIESHTLTLLHGAVLLGSALLYFAFTLVFSVTCVTCNSPANPLGIETRFMSDPVFYCVCVLTTLLALLPRILYRCVRNSICPSDIVKASHLDKLTTEERRVRIQSWREVREHVGPLLTTAVTDPALTGAHYTECNPDTDSVLS
ncbi:hypothetical protein JZ751_022339 [Albula glossodonta]|uniref:Phospholipid-transporting ATPase n=1 Tax=Albula glossodonta TaxID=121402 RepID=A0A8T2NU19_9TELE|nr:hypothetical protein JZ751_022339 [Albula glossodonta]